MPKITDGRKGNADLGKPVDSHRDVDQEWLDADLARFIEEEDKDQTIKGLHADLARAQIDMEEFARRGDEIERLKDEVEKLKKSIRVNKSEHRDTKKELEKILVKYSDAMRELIRHEDAAVKLDMLERIIRS